MSDIPKRLPGMKRKLNPAYVALWESYLDEGMSAKAVAEIFGVAHTTVARSYPGRGWTPAQKLEHSFTVRRLNKLGSS